MTPTITVDSSQWKQAAKELFKTSSRSCVDFINGQALKVSIEAVRRTERASAKAIRAELGARTVDAKSGPRGKSLAERLLGWRFRKNREWGVDGSTMAERVRNLIAVRVRSGSFIASGWIPARRRLFTVVRERPPGASASFAGARQYGKEKGSAVPAYVGGLRSLISATIVNQALMEKSKEPSKARDPMPVAVRGLQAALDESARDMAETLAKRLKKDLEKFNAH